MRHHKSKIDTTTNTLVDLVSRRAELSPEHGYTFLGDGVAVSDSLSYLELDRTCRRIAAAIQSSGVDAGSRAILLYAPGLEFVRAFWACAYAGIVAVTAPPPDPARPQRTVPRLQAIAADCKPTIVLTDSSVGDHRQLCQWVPELAAAALIDTPRLVDAGERWSPPDIDGQAIAVIQYTSGSTGTPRGVVITHSNFLHNLAMLEAFQGHQTDLVMVHWLPLFHDMGLIRGMMSPLHMGGECIMMPPMQFMQRPALWLAAASRFHATSMGAPNFGYELCNRKIPDAVVDSLDLSAMRIAFCSSEPIRASTVNRFIEKFAPCGFSRSAFRPSYGLAEATVMVCGEVGDNGPQVRSCDRRALMANRFIEVEPNGANTLEVTSCGLPAGGQQVVTVNAFGCRTAADEIGEIRVRGPSVGNGYWNNPAASREIFCSELADGDGPYLRTGDLGWISPSGELFVTGRQKDLIIVRGQNYYPHDIEWIVEDAVPELRRGCTAAFSIENALDEAIVIVCELATAKVATADFSQLLTAIRAAVSMAFDLRLAAVAFVARGAIFKTASGKVQRTRVRAGFVDHGLPLLHLWTARKRD